MRDSWQRVEGASVDCDCGLHGRGHHEEKTWCMESESERNLADPRLGLIRESPIFQALNERKTQSPNDDNPDQVMAFSL